MGVVAEQADDGGQRRGVAGRSPHAIDVFIDDFTTADAVGVMSSGRRRLFPIAPTYP
jgi:hypothetical protein